MGPFLSRVLCRKNTLDLLQNNIRIHFALLDYDFVRSKQIRRRIDVFMDVANNG